MSGGAPITARQLESLVRLAEARARVDLREEVTRADAEVGGRALRHGRPRGAGAGAAMRWVLRPVFGQQVERRRGGKEGMRATAFRAKPELHGACRCTTNPGSRPGPCPLTQLETCKLKTAGNPRTP
jgi:hypothetical protein